MIVYIYVYGRPAPLHVSAMRGHGVDIIGKLSTDVTESNCLCLSVSARLYVQTRAR